MTVFGFLLQCLHFISKGPINWGTGGDAVNFDQTNQGTELEAFSSHMYALMQFGDTSLTTFSSILQLLLFLS